MSEKTFGGLIFGGLAIDNSELANLEVVRMTVEDTRAFIKGELDNEPVTPALDKAQGSVLFKLSQRSFVLIVVEGFK